MEKMTERANYEAARAEREAIEALTHTRECFVAMVKEMDRAIGSLMECKTSPRNKTLEAVARNQALVVNWTLHSATTMVANNARFDRLAGAQSLLNSAATMLEMIKAIDAQ